MTRTRLGAGRDGYDSADSSPTRSSLWTVPPTPSIFLIFISLDIVARSWLHCPRRRSWSSPLIEISSLVFSSSTVGPAQCRPSRQREVEPIGANAQPQPSRFEPPLMSSCRCWCHPNHCWRHRLNWAVTVHYSTHNSTATVQSPFQARSESDSKSVWSVRSAAEFRDTKRISQLLGN